MHHLSLHFVYICKIIFTNIFINIIKIIDKVSSKHVLIPPVSGRYHQDTLSTYATIATASQTVAASVPVHKNGIS